jgi:methionyl-tRNA formyltransferase
MSVQDGVGETGVSLSYTVRALDAGPVIAYERLSVDDFIKVDHICSLASLMDHLSCSNLCKNSWASL